MRVLLVGLFSAKRKDYNDVLDALSQRVIDSGSEVVGRVVQRRGASAGGARKMDQPLLRRTVLGSGKVREVAATVQQTGAELVVFTNALTDHQRAVLTEELGARVISADEWEGS